MSHDIDEEAAGDSPMQTQSERKLLVLPPSERDYRQGELNARVVLVEYGDYQCLKCGELYSLIKTIQGQLDTTAAAENYLCFVFRQFPQSQIHPQAQKAATAALAAGAQGQFWQMHDLLFSHQQALGNGYLVEYANDLGLDISQFLRAISRQMYRDRINEEIASGLQSGVETLPALFLNGIQYRDRWEIEPLMAAIVAASNAGA